MKEFITPFLGYLAMALLIISFIMKDVKAIRVINLIGCLCFVVYGFILGPEPAYPIIITNVAISLIQIYYLFLAKKD